MRISAAAPSLLLLLLPALTSAKVLVKRDVLAAPAVAQKDRAAIATPVAATNPTVKLGVGTKDAPVDGLDGKPHAGPFVDVSIDKKKKPAAGVEDIKKPLPTSLKKLQDGAELIPEKNDGVMDATDRVAPKEGTTGTEGGVSERTKNEKSLDSTSGEKLEKDPIAPKEAPPVPQSEEGETKLKGVPQDKLITLTGKPKGAQGLEVSL